MNHRRLAAICAAVITLAVLSLIVRDSIVVRHAAAQGRPVTVEGKSPVTGTAPLGDNRVIATAVQRVEQEAP